MGIQWSDIAVSSDEAEELPVGYLIFGDFTCRACSSKLGSDVCRTPVYKVNIGQYSQQCSKCKSVVMQGPFNVELFRPMRFGRAEVDAHVHKIGQALSEADDEAYVSYRRDLYESVLQAIMEDRLDDRDYVFEVVRGMFKQV